VQSKIHRYKKNWNRKEACLW